MHAKSWLHAWSLLMLGVFPVGNAGAEEFMFRAMVGGREVEGQALHWNSSHMLLMARDGRLEHFDPRQATEGKKTASEFIPYTAAETRQRLLAEFGRGFRVSTSAHYFVVHSAEVASPWADRFEGLYRHFHSVFRARGFDLEEPKVPLVAVIFPTRGDYASYMEQQGITMPESTLGHYDPKSNRVLMYDQRGSAEVEDETLKTIVHEATHQTAYNVGLHSRAAITPRWLVEGLAMMFETQDQQGSTVGQDRSDRVHRGRLEDFRTHRAQKGGRGDMRRLIASDEVFESDTLAAYANAWALSFFLAETRPREYEAYLKLTAARPPMAAYSPRARVDDFASLFGDDLVQLEAEFVRWVERL